MHGLAVSCGCTVPSPQQRICEIRWTHDGDEWVATVGEKLSMAQGCRCGGEAGTLSTSLLRCATR